MRGAGGGWDAEGRRLCLSPSCLLPRPLAASLLHFKAHPREGVPREALTEVTGTKIQNRKYISIYINTQPGEWEDAGFFPQRVWEAGAGVGVRNSLHLF